MAYEKLSSFLIPIIVIITLSSFDTQIRVSEARHLLEETLELPKEVPHELLKPQLPPIPTFPKPELPSLPKPELPQIPKPEILKPELPKKLELPELPKPELPQIPKIPELPKLPELPRLPEIPKPTFPIIPNVSNKDDHKPSSP